MDTQSKENMQNTIKNLEDKIINIEKILDKGQDCLIFQYGSQTIKFNRANEMAPKSILNLIAYQNIHKYQQPQVLENYEEFDQQLLLLENRLRTNGVFKNESKDHKINKGKPRGKVDVDLRNLPYFLNAPQKQESNHLCPFQQELDDRRMVVEEEVYLVEGNPEYVVRQPVRFGYLNGEEAVNDLYRLTVYCITNKLGISMQAVRQMNCILVIPDVFQRQQVKQIVDMLFRQCGFKQVYIHLESILAQFAANITIGCIVDIGYEKINISCVDEGVIIPGYQATQLILYLEHSYGRTLDPETQIQLFFVYSRKSYITIIHFIRTQFKKSFRLDQKLFSDLNQIGRLKEWASQLSPQDDKLNHIYELHTVREGKEERFLIPSSSALCVAPHILFEPQALNALNRPHDPQFDFTSRVFEMYYDPEDNMEELSGGVQLSWCWGSKEREQQFLAQPEIHEQLHPCFMQPLDQMVFSSIAAVYDPEQRMKIAQNIVLIGGGSHLNDLAETLEKRLPARATEMDLPEIDRFDVKVIVREDIRPQWLSWTGASVLPKTESMGEMWISRQKWLGEFEPHFSEVDEALEQFDGDIGNLEKKVMLLAKKEKDKEKSNEWGIKHLKEKIPFVW